MMPLCFGPMNRAGGPLFVFPHATAGPSARIRAVGRCDILRGMKTTKKKSAKASKPSRLTHGAPTVAAGTSRMRLRGTNPVRVKAILEGLDEMYPAATCELKHANPFQLLISTIMSAQCTDVRVNEVAKTLYVKYPTANHFAYANPSELEQEIRPTGFFRNKTKSIMGASKAIVEQFDGKVPQTMDELLNLPGVARKTANVVLGSGFGIASGVVVDTHVIRLSNRLDLTKHSDPKKIELDLIKIIPQDKWVIFSHQLIWHGRRLCVARKPRCAECKIEHLCYAKDKTI
jgi:endonuclease III